MAVSSVVSTQAYPSTSSTQTAASVDGSDFAAILAAAQASGETAAQPSRSAASQPSAAADPNAWLDTSDGKSLVNLDDYFTPKTALNFNDPHSLPPLLLPSAGNIQALSSDAAGKFRQLLADSGIPAAPSKITYGSDGKAQFPSDYAYADQLKQALAGDPALQRELSTVNALTSHFVEMKKSLPFLQAYEAAGSQQEADAVVAKFSYLFGNQRPTSQIALQFSADGSLTVTADGKPYNES